MKRREFLKYIGAIPFAGSLLSANRHPMPTEKDLLWADVTRISTYSTSEGPFTQYYGIWFFADQDNILWCPLNDLRVDNWSSFTVPQSGERFHFWLQEEGKLFWVGKRCKLLIVCNQGEVRGIIVEEYFG